MPLLSYSSSDYPFVPFTKIFSTDINQCFNDIKTLLNTTGLDDTNIQTAGITPTTKLKTTGATSGQFLGYNGTGIVWTNNPLTSQYNVVIGSAAQVTSGVATNSTFASYTQADGDRVLLLPTYATNEAWTITKKIFIQGLGDTSIVQGAITINSGGSYTRISGLQTQSSLTIASGVVGIIIPELWFSGTNTFVDNNPTSSPSPNILFAIQG